MLLTIHVPTYMHTKIQISATQNQYKSWLRTSRCAGNWEQKLVTSHYYQVHGTNNEEMVSWEVASVATFTY